MRENPMFPKLTSKLSSPTSTAGMPRPSSSTASEQLSVVTDLLDSAFLMTTNNTWSSTNQTSDWESWPSYQKETPKEKLRNNLKEKLKNPEVPKRLKSLPPEKYKPKPTSEEPRKNTLKNLSHDSVYSTHYFYILLILDLSSDKQIKLINLIKCIKHINFESFLDYLRLKPCNFVSNGFFGPYCWNHLTFLTIILA